MVLQVVTPADECRVEYVTCHKVCVDTFALVWLAFLMTPSLAENKMTALMPLFAFFSFLLCVVFVF